MPPHLSVVIPMYNAGRTIRKCLDSILASPYRDLEIIVVNDNSNDGCEGIVAEYDCRLINVFTKGNAGAGAARNIGAREASGEIIYFTDADIIQTHDTIQRIVQAFDRDPALAVLAGVYSKEPATPGFGSSFVALKTFYFASRGPARKRISFVQSGCFAIRKSVFVETKGFYEKRAAEEYDYGHRLSRRYPIIMDQGIVVVHHHPKVLERLVEITRRTYYWFPLFMRRRAFETDGGTGSRQEGTSALLVFLSLLAFALASVLAALRAPGASAALLVGALALTIVLVWNAGLYRFMARERSGWFALGAILTDILLYLGVGCGASAAVLAATWQALAGRDGARGGDQA